MVLYMKSKIYYGSTSLTCFLFCACSDYQQSTREPIQVDRLCCQRRQFRGFGGGVFRRNGQRDGGGLQCGHRCGGNHSLPHARSAQQDFCDLALDRTNTKLQWYQVQVTKKIAFIFNQARGRLDRFQTFDPRWVNTCCIGWLWWLVGELCPYNLRKKKNPPCFQLLFLVTTRREMCSPAASRISCWIYMSLSLSACHSHLGTETALLKLHWNNIWFPPCTRLWQCFSTNTLGSLGHL